jgi:hypothetical protein
MTKKSALIKAQALPTMHAGLRTTNVTCMKASNDCSQHPPALGTHTPLGPSNPGQFQHRYYRRKHPLTPSLLSRSNTTHHHPHYAPKPPTIMYLDPMHVEWASPDIGTKTEWVIDCGKTTLHFRRNSNTVTKITTPLYIVPSRPTRQNLQNNNHQNIPRRKHSALEHKCYPSHRK